MKSVIVTGANGFVGSAVTKELLLQNFEVLAIVHADNRSNLPDNPHLQIVSCEMSEISSLTDYLPQNKYDLFYHFAWSGSAGPLRTDYELQLKNAKWSLDAIATASKLGCKRFIAAGSIVEDEVWAAVNSAGNKPGAPYIYGAGKIVFHQMGSPLAAKLGIELVWGKITNTYGVGELSPRLVNTTLRKCIDGISPEFTSGVQNYDFIYIDDLAKAFYLLGQKGKPFSSYVLGSGQAKPLREFLEELHYAVAPELPFLFGDVPFTGTNLPLSAFNADNLYEDTGFIPEYSFVEGCKKTIAWLKSR